MAKKRKKPSKTEDPKLEIAPMLDVTFLLLIFFICTIKFKTLEGRLDAYLPKDMGSQRTSSETLENIEVRLRPKDNVTNVYVGRTLVERITSQDKEEDISRSLTKLQAEIRRVNRALQEESPCIIDPDPQTPHGHVVAVLNTIMAEELEKVTFTMPAKKK